MAKTLQQITEELVSLVAANFSPRLVDTRIGTVLRDAFIGPVAAQFFDAFSEVAQVSRNQSIQSPDSLPESVMDGLAGNFGLSRFAGSQAVGIVRFFKVVPPAGNITIPAGTSVATGSTNDADARVFKTLSSVQLTPASLPDPITGAAVSVDVAAMADFSGEAGNVDAGTIAFLLDPIPGIDGVINPSAMTGGKERQTNAELADLIKARAQGRLGTKTGYRDLILSNFAVTDVEVIGRADEDSTRAQFGGEVDVIVLSNVSASAVETFAYVNPATTTQLVPTFRPLISVDSITGVDSADDPITLSGPAGGVGLGVDYDVILDTSGPLAGSFRENSRIVLHPVANIPKNNSTLTVSYQDNDQIRVIQAFLDLDENKVIGADPMAKAGVRVEAVVEADIRVIPGFSVPTVSAAVNAAIENLFSGLNLGENVQASDVITAIGNVDGVDFVDTSTFVLALSTAPLTNVQEILAKKHEYIRVSSVTINNI